MADVQPTVAKGSISKKEDRPTDKHPAYGGSLTITEDLRAGTKLWLAGWINKGDDGSTYMTLKGSRARSGPTRFGDQGSQPRRNAIDDDIPF